MKKILKISLITSLFMAAGLVALTIWATKVKNENKKEEGQLLNEQLDEGDTRSFSSSVQEKATPLYAEGQNRNVLVYPHGIIYDVAVSKSIQDQLEQKASRGQINFVKPVIAYNPYGTQENTFYFFFETSSELMVKYTITTEDTSIPDFTRVVYNGDQDNCSKKHSFTVRGLVPGVKNYIILSLQDKDGKIMGTQYYSYDAKPSSSDVKARAVVEKGKSEQRSSNGLYLAFPANKKGIFIYDNSGILRGEMPVSTNLGKKLVVGSNSVFYTISDSSIARLSLNGQVTGVYDIKNYGKAIDFDYDGFGNLYVLVEKKGQNKLIRVPVDSNHSVVSFRFSNKTRANSVKFMGKGTIYASMSKPAGIMKIVNAASNVAKVGGIYGDSKIWGNTPYRKKVCKFTGKEPISAGQSLLLSSKSSTLTFFNNDVSDQSSSYYYEYAFSGMTARVSKRIKVDYSKAFGSGQSYEGNYVICNGITGKYGEYDNNGVNLKAFSIGIPLRSVIKENFKMVYFY